MLLTVTGNLLTLIARNFQEFCHLQTKKAIDFRMNSDVKYNIANPLVILYAKCL